MKKLLFALTLATTISNANAVPSYYHTSLPIPETLSQQPIHIHHDRFDRQTYLMGGIMIGIAAVMLVWVITDKYYDPTHYSVQF